MQANGFVCVGTCRVCGQGLLGVRVCSDHHPPIVLCQECESIWQTPQCEGSPQHSIQPGSRCPICDQPLFTPPAHWADQTEIARLGWSDSITGPSETSDYSN